ncbi:MAG: hypothetical protein ABEH65_05905 [Halobacteriales archaeon]
MHKPPIPTSRDRFSVGLDTVLLGLIAVIVGGYIALFASLGNQSPHLLRFFDYESPSVLPTLAATPEESALVLLVDDRSTSSQTVEGGLLELAPQLPEFLSMTLMILGGLLVIGAPLWLWFEWTPFDHIGD